MCNNKDFVHLHNHSHYSVQDALASPAELATAASQLGFSALALTDHGKMAGTVEFVDACKNAEEPIKPIIGCCIKGQPIYTSSGIKEIEKVKIGDMVLTHTGEYKKVTNTMDHIYSGKLYGIESSYNNTVWLTDEHPIYIYDTRTDKYNWVRADILEEMKRKNPEEKNCIFAVFPKVKSDYKKLNIFYSTTTGEPIPLDTVLAKVLGVFLRSGSIIYSSENGAEGLRWLLKPSDMLIVHYLQSTLFKIYNQQCDVSYDKPKNKVTVIFNNKDLASLFYHLTQLNPAIRLFPRELFHTSAAIQRAFFDGFLYNISPSRKSSKLKVERVSKDIAYQMKAFAALLNYNVIIKKNTHNCDITVFYKKENNHLHHKDLILTPINNVKVKLFRGIVFNLEVEDNHSYVTDITLHNCEVYTCEDMLDKTAPEGRKRPKHNHLTLLAKNQTGYQNLLQISSIAAQEGYYYEPRIDHKVLEKHSEGIIALSGCLASEVNQSLCKDDYNLAKTKAERLKNIFSDFFIELQYHGIEEQKQNTPKLIQLAKELDLPLVASNDVHYISKPDFEIHDILISMRDLRENKTYNPMSGKKQAYSSHQFYLKSANQMQKIFDNVAPEATKNSVLIGEMVEDYFKLDVPHLLPEAEIPDNPEFLKFKSSTLPYHPKNDAYLAYLAFDGLKKLGLDQNKTYVNRLKKELSQIWFMGVTDYFLIHNEIVDYMKQSDILYGIRGSGVASLVNYCLEISNIDPIRWNLLFERFLNPGRGTQYDLKFKTILEQPDYEKEEKINIITEDVATKILKENIQQELIKKPELEVQKAHLAKELWIIENQGLSNYYVDILNSGKTIKENEINSWVAYTLNITKSPPKGNLIIKKVATLPDVDTDVDKARREEVIDWMKTRFGADKVMNIGAWGTYQAKAAVAGSLKTSNKFNTKFGDKVAQESMKITGCIPKHPVDITIDEALEKDSSFKWHASQWPEEINNAKELVGKISNLTVHAAGVIVSKEPICLHAPIEKAKDSFCSGYDMGSVERIGLVKYDILGLKTLTMLSLAKKLIFERKHEIINLRKLNLEDEKVLELFRKGLTTSIFQFGSVGMKDSLKGIKASTMEELIAVVSLYRPGPVKFIPEYAKRKLGKSEYSLNHPLFEKYLASTYGILIYQEQAMYLAKDMAKFSWNEVDKLRKAISKKSSKDFKIICDKFSKQANENNIPEKIIVEVLSLMETFGEYAFNRAHAASYADLAFQTGYMKTYHPLEWMTACIQVVIDDTDAKKDEKLLEYFHECKDMGITVKMPEVNKSGLKVEIVDDEIVLPLTYCKGAGNQALSVVENKPYDNLDDFIHRSGSNKTIFKALAFGGALDIFEEIKDYENEDELISYYDNSIKESKKLNKKANSINIINKTDQVKREWSADAFFEDI